ncbi:alpha/beta fold hydrolase [Caballeronia sp. S22]|uniref:alpha/beta fold hydrolase n=1 Tax=Caballeronia sp. S22 TaxID=3137182 RepID=UPI0035315092
MNTPLLDRGTGPAILLAHGTLMDHTMFRHQVNFLSSKFRTIAYGLRAATAEAEHPYSNQDLVSDCLALMNDLEIDRCVLGGLSMGGFMAIDFVLQHPDRVAGLVLFDSMSVAYTDDEKRLFGQHFDPLDRDGSLSSSFIEWFVPVIFSQHAMDHQPEMIEDWKRRWAKRSARSLYYEYRSWIGKPDVTAKLHELKCPTLILHGADDRGIDPEQARNMQESIAGAKLRLIKDCGHACTEEAPEKVNALLTEFLDHLQPW